jgi:hypothetical protein
MTIKPNPKSPTLLPLKFLKYKKENILKIIREKVTNDSKPTNPDNK